MAFSLHVVIHPGYRKETRFLSSLALTLFPHHTVLDPVTFDQSFPLNYELCTSLLLCLCSCSSPSPSLFFCKYYPFFNTKFRHSLWDLELDLLSIHLPLNALWGLLLLIVDSYWGKSSHVCLDIDKFTCVLSRKREVKRDCVSSDSADLIIYEKDSKMGPQTFYPSTKFSFNILY